MKWAVLFFNIVTLAVLAYTVSLQMGELGYYDSVEADAVKSMTSTVAPAETPAPAADVKVDSDEAVATDTDTATEPAADTAPAEEAE